MIADPREILNDAEKNNYAIAGINVPTFDAVWGVIEAAEELNCPVMLSHAEAHDPFAPIDEIAPVMLDAARRAKVPVILHLDHGFSYSYVMKAVRNGFTSIMYDCSERPFAENVKELREFAALAHGLGIVVEAEIGRMPSTMIGHGGCTQNNVPVKNMEDFFTLPEEAKKFAEGTKGDMLTVSFGSVHGRYVTQPKLDIERLKAIHAVTPAHLVMHGTTGIDDAQITAAVNGGIRKFNFYTGVGTSPIEPILQAQKKAVAEDELFYIHDIAKISRECVKEKAKYVINLFRNNVPAV